MGGGGGGEVGGGVWSGLRNLFFTAILKVVGFLWGVRVFEEFQSWVNE